MFSVYLWCQLWRVTCLLSHLMLQVFHLKWDSAFSILHYTLELIWAWGIQPEHAGQVELMRKPSTDREQEPLSFRRTILGGILLAVQVISVELPSSQWSQQTTPPDLTHAQLPHSCFLGSPPKQTTCIQFLISARLSRQPTLRHSTL